MNENGTTDEPAVEGATPAAALPRVRLQIKQGAALGPGKAALLEALDKLAGNKSDQYEIVKEAGEEK